MSFSDYYSEQADNYARYRPNYPAELFSWLTAQAPSRGLCWDVATGSGQAASGLAEHFSRVVATDASAQQVRTAVSNPRIEYRQENANQSSLPDGSVSLITVAAAAHWLPLEDFYREVRRVAVPGAVLAMWSYGILPTAPSDLASLVTPLDTQVLAPHWPPEIQTVRDRYTTLPFPFPERAPPVAKASLSLEPHQFRGLIRTWSGSVRYSAATAQDPAASLEDELQALWPAGKREISWELFFRVGTVSPR